MRGKKGGSGLLLRLGFPVLKVLLLYLLVEMFLPVNVCLRLEILSLGMAPKSLLLAHTALNFPKYKAKVKSKVKIGAGLQSVACFFRPANRSRSDG